MVSGPELAPLEARFYSSMERLCPEWPDGRYVLGFSGGSDSMAALCLLRRFLAGERLLAAHLDHALRETSAEEAQRAQEMAAALGIRCESRRVLVKKAAEERGKGLEEAARAARYEFLSEVLTEFRGDWLVTAHQAEDQAETVIMKLVRGAGPGALVGIAAKSGRVVRPLLGESRETLREYLAVAGARARAVVGAVVGAEPGAGAGVVAGAELGAATGAVVGAEPRTGAGVGAMYIDDPSNEDVRIERNLVRLEIAPVLKRLNPRYLAAFGRAAEIARGEEEFWAGHLDSLIKDLDFKEERGWYAVKAESLERLTVAERRRVIGRLMRLVNLDRAGPGGGEPVSLAGVETALAFLEKPRRGGWDLPGGRRVEWRGQYLYVGPASRYATYNTRARASAYKGEGEGEGEGQGLDED